MARLVKQQIRVIQAEDETALADQQQPKECAEAETKPRQLPAGDFSPATFVHA